MLKLVLLVAIFSPLSLAITDFRDCGNGAALPESVIINLCDEAPCVFHLGDNIVANAIAVSPINSQSANASLEIVFAGIRTPYPLPPDTEQACPHLKPTCPITTGTRYEYQFQLVIDDIPIGGVPVRLQISLNDDDKNPIFCINFQATVNTTPRPPPFIV